MTATAMAAGMTVSQNADFRRSAGLAKAATARAGISVRVYRCANPIPATAAPYAAGHQGERSLSKDRCQSAAAPTVQSIANAYGRFSWAKREMLGISSRTPHAK